MLVLIFLTLVVIAWLLWKGNHQRQLDRINEQRGVDVANMLMKEFSEQVVRQAENELVQDRSNFGLTFGLTEREATAKLHQIFREKCIEIQSRNRSLASS